MSSCYNSDEIRMAVATVRKIAKQRVPNYTGNDEHRKSISDLIKVCLDPNVHANFLWSAVGSSATS